MISSGLAGAGRRMRRAAGLGALGLALGGLAGVAAGQEAKGNLEGPAGAPSVTTRTTTYGGWTVNCSQTAGAGKEVCSASFKVVSQQNKDQVVLVWLLGRDGEGQRMAEFVTITGILIRPGVTVRLDDGAPLKAEYVACGTGSCTASLALSDKSMAQLKAAKTVRVGLTSTDNKPVEFSFDIPGIAEAITGVGF